MTCKNLQGRFPSKRGKVRFRDFSPLITLHRTKFSSPNLEIISIEEDPGSNFPSSSKFSWSASMFFGAVTKRWILKLNRHKTDLVSMQFSLKENLYRQTPIFRHPFFRKQCFSLKYVLVTPLKIFGGMSKFGINVIVKSSLLF